MDHNRTTDYDIFTDEPEYEALSPSSLVDGLVADDVAVKPNGGRDARDHKKE
jgi:hypothetical protein